MDREWVNQRQWDNSSQRDRVHTEDLQEYNVVQHHGYSIIIQFMN